MKQIKGFSTSRLQNGEHFEFNDMNVNAINDLITS